MKIPIVVGVKTSWISELWNFLENFLFELDAGRALGVLGKIALRLCVLGSKPPGYRSVGAELSCANKSGPWKCQNLNSVHSCRGNSINFPLPPIKKKY